VSPPAPEEDWGKPWFTQTFHFANLVVNEPLPDSAFQLGPVPAGTILNNITGEVHFLDGADTLEEGLSRK